MKNLKKQILKTIWRTVLTLVLVAGFAALSAVGWTQLALADAGGVKGHTFDVTFTKWLTSFPHMVGVVGGDVGDGTYVGRFLISALWATLLRSMLFTTSTAEPTPLPRTSL